ncbi:spore protease YyaC [Desulfovirgula thermocuniculi]|uniref:spore protease YyaC n=1 Tax=Desulfovirgula thermocuniculi TaxID=348842 RepID=UPI00041CA980|nr:spore protease YyaC [Desulfovirgula thermocuniculi]
MINKVCELYKAEKTRIHIDDSLAAQKLGYDLFYRLERAGALQGRPLVLLCIGTDRSTGDCLGPLVGTKLAATPQETFIVHGTLEHPVHATNLQEKLAEIYREHRDPVLVAVDASLGSLESVGYITVGDGALRPGAGVHKSLPPVGEVHVTGIVNVGGFMEYMVLQNTRLNLVMRMAEVITQGILQAAALVAKKEAREM